MHFISISLFLFSSFLLAQSTKLPEVQTKQTLSNIRYLTHDGKFTYFQQNGKLYLSTNYSNDEINSSDSSTSYLIMGTSSRKKLIIEEEKNYFRELNPRKRKNLYSIKYGGKQLVKVGEGNILSLNQDDSWINYFDIKNQSIIAKNINRKMSEIRIKLKNDVNPYFIPQSYMPTKDTIFYTDINANGVMALIMYSIYDKSFKTIYKSRFKAMNLNFCMTPDSIFIGEFSYDTIDKGSAIYKVPLYENKGFQKISQIYSSNLNDIGNLICTKENLFFIKTFDENKKLNMKRTEVAKLELKTNKIKLITDLRFVTNILNMDGNILVPFRDKYFVAQGKSVLNDDKLLKN